MLAHVRDASSRIQTAMFESVRDKLTSALKKLRGEARLTESNMKGALREVRLALLDADVSYKVVRQFIKDVTDKAIGEDVIKSVQPGQQVVKIVQDEIVNLMGPVDHRIPFADPPPTKIMLAGLQGSGKTTTCGKLAKFIESKGHTCMLVAADVQRPAAIEQLKVIGEQIGVAVYTEKAAPPKICANAIKRAPKEGCDVVIMDTAGRLHIDNDMMHELREIAVKTKPDQVFLVCDSMTGQDAVNSAAEFNAQLELDGVILTKLDGDARGGAALSVKAVTGKPIKFVGVGEKMDQLEEFHPERMASRILGMGDVVSLVEKAQAAVDQEDALALQQKILKNKLTLDDFLSQLQSVRKMGPLKDLLGMIPGMGDAGVGDMDVNEGELKHIEAIIQSMTTDERLHPEIIDQSRRLRIARGSGSTTHDVGQLLKQFRQMRKMLKGFMGGDAGGMMGMRAPGAATRAKQRSKRKRRKRRGR